MSTHHPIEFSVVMPCLDEAETVGVCVLKAVAFFTGAGIRAEVLIADNGSRDESVAIAEQLGARVVRVEDPGYGAALLGGIRASRGRYVIMGDCDDSYDWLALEGIVEELRRGHDLVMGNRFAGGIADRAMPFLHRYLGNPALSAVLRWVFHSPCGDAYCGLRGFRRDAFDALELRSRGWEFALEMVAKSAMAGLSYAEVPVTLSPDGRDRKPHLSTWRDGWASLRFMLLFGPWAMLVQPGLLMLGGAVLLGAWALSAPTGVDVARGPALACALAGVLALLGQQAASLGAHGRHLLEVLGRHPRRHDDHRRLSAAVLPSLAFVLGAACLGVVINSWSERGLDGFASGRGGRALLLGCFALPASIQSLLAKLRGAMLDMAHVDPTPVEARPLLPSESALDDTLTAEWIPEDLGVFPPPAIDVDVPEEPLGAR